MNITEAVRSLRPNSSFSVKGDTYEGIKWCDPDNNIPTKEEVQTKVTGLQAEYDALEYARNRQAEYPDMGTQFNKIYDDGIDAWKTDMVDPIKAKYPKP